MFILDPKTKTKKNGKRSKLTVYPVENVFPTRSETANRVYRNFRTGPGNFPILFGFDASKGISCSESPDARNFELSKFPPMVHRWTTGGHRWESFHVI